MDMYLQMTVLAERKILDFVVLANSKNKTVRMANLLRAYGVFSLWDNLTIEHQKPDDAAYLISLIPSAEVDCLLLEYELAQHVTAPGNL